MHARRTPAASRHHADSNIRPRLAVERAAWITCDALGDAPGFRMRCPVALASARTLAVQLSADQRFELRCDGRRVGFGPDRGDRYHWACHEYALELDAGEHLLELTIWTLGEDAPQAALTERPACILAAVDPELAPLVDTGSAAWEVAPLTGIVPKPPTAGVFGVGSGFTIDHAATTAVPTWAPAAVAEAPVTDDIYGQRRDMWRLDPSPLPEQIYQAVPTGVVRVVDDGSPALFGESAAPEIARWQAAVAGEAPATVAAGERVRLIVDLETYVCAFPELRLTGTGSAVLEWAESAFEPGEDYANPHHTPKGDRSALIGKRWLGFGDRFVASGSDEQRFELPWWRAGRYLMLVLEGGAGGLALGGLELFESRYPLEDEGAFASDDSAFAPVRELCVRGLQMCAHETYMDCPYYEQMMYVGDTRVQALVHFHLQRDARLQARAIDLYDWSRSECSGFIAERYPARHQQLSLSFSLIWPLMVHDFARWRDDAASCRRWLAGVRSLLDRFALLPDDEGLLSDLPGWTFMDWVRGWKTGYPPSGKHGTSTIVNLHYVLALEAAADLERWHGDARMAERWDELAAAVAARIDARFWREDRGLYADDATGTAFSQHAQSLVVLSRSFSDERKARCFAAMLAADDLAECTVYYSHYRLEAYRAMGRGDLIHAEFDFWKALIAQGFVTPVESPEPSRSDCHAWGAHPLYHASASLLGLRPAGPGFERYELRPSPGPLCELSQRLPHPRGEISASVRRDGEAWTIAVDSPVPGAVHLEGEVHQLAAGKQTLQLTAVS